MLRLKNRRVLLITEEYPPEIGGIQSYLSQLWAKLPADFACVLAKEQFGARGWDTKQKYKVIRTKTKSFFIPRWLPALIKLKKAIKEFQPEVIVCGKALFEGRAAYLIYKRTGIPYVVITHAMEINSWLAHRKTKRDLLRVLNNAARILVINQKIKELLKANGVPESKFVKMYPGVDDFFAEKVGEHEELKKELGFENKKMVVTVCRLVHRKGVDVALRAWTDVIKKIPDALYLIIGEGSEKDNLKKLCDDLKLAESVKFLGYQSGEEIRKILQAADLFLMTPRDEGGNMEGFGIVYMEAAAAGLCAVGSKSGGVSEAVLDGETGLLAKENDPSDTAEKIMDILSNEEMRKKLSTNARERALREFVWSKRAQLFRGVIESVILEKEKTK